MEMIINLTRDVGDWGAELSIDEHPRTSSLNLPRLECSRMTFVPHAHTTHIESAEHLRMAGTQTKALCDQLPSTMTCSVWPRAAEAEVVIIPSNLLCLFTVMQAILRCEKLRIVATDAVSLDPPNDGGALLSHRALWSFKPKVLIIELCDKYAIDRMNSDTYNCHISVFPFWQSDAVPVCLHCWK